MPLSDSEVLAEVVRIAALDAFGDARQREDWPHIKFYIDLLAAPDMTRGQEFVDGARAFLEGVTAKSHSAIRGRGPIIDAIREIEEANIAEVRTHLKYAARAIESTIAHSYGMQQLYRMIVGRGAYAEQL